MFNLKKNKTAGNIQPYEKYLRDNHLGPEIEDIAKITEKKLTDKTGNEYVTTEAQMNKLNTSTEKDDSMILEKVLNDVTGKYIKHRSANDELNVTSINSEVEKIRRARVNNDYKTEKKDHWSLTYNEKKQFGDLPEWNNIADEEHVNIWSNNDKTMINDTPAISKSAIDQVAFHVKTGKTNKFDSTIVSILKQAHVENRELTEIEQKVISEIKKNRTNFVLSNINNEL